jgi:hypothetical protein
MNIHLPEPAMRFKAVFVVDLTREFRVLDNLITDGGVIDEPAHTDLIVWATVQVMQTWGFAYYTKPLPNILAAPEILTQIQRYLNTSKFELEVLYRILRHAPSVEIDEILVDQGCLYFCYEDKRWAPHQEQSYSPRVG